VVVPGRVERAGRPLVHGEAHDGAAGQGEDRVERGEREVPVRGDQQTVVAAGAQTRDRPGRVSAGAVGDEPLVSEPGGRAADMGSEGHDRSRGHVPNYDPNPLV
jgi:hypothetical protein